MPIYEYKCKKCRHKFEEFQSVGATNEGLVCPNCGEPKPERLLSMFGATGTTVSIGSSAGCSSSSPFS